LDERWKQAHVLGSSNLDAVRIEEKVKEIHD